MTMAKTNTCSTELVITAPEPHAAALTYATRCRSTFGVLVQLFADATHHVVIASPFMQSAAVAGTGALALAVQSALERGIRLDILSTQKNLSDARLRVMVEAHAANVRLFVPWFPGFDASPLGSHAKFCIRDGEAAYIGSANLTGPGLHQHFEMGLLVSGRVAAAMQDFWDFATKHNLFVRTSITEVFR